MKKLLTFTTIAIFGLAIFSGCSTSSSSSPSYSMKATLGTTAYNAPNCIAVGTGTTMVIEGLGGASTTPTFPYVDVIIANWTNTTGTSNFDTTMAASYGQYLTSSTAYKLSKTGSVTVTSVSSTTITGTFSFTCTDGTVVSGGTFTAKKM